jgi:carbamoyltransferase
MHDPALAILDSRGCLRFAEAAERYLQNKRAYNSPPDDFLRTGELIEEYCEEGADLVVSNTWRSGWLHLIRISMLPLDLYYMITNRLSIRLGREALSIFLGAVHAPRYEQSHWAITSLLNSSTQAVVNLKESALIDNIRRTLRVESIRGNGLCGRSLIFRSYDHHLTHAAAACYGSPFSDAVCAIIDAHGESGSVAFYTYKSGGLEKIKIRPSRISLGHFYMLLCFACGFNAARGEEWKVMGLAAHGSFKEHLYQKLRKLFCVEGLRLVPGDERRRILHVLSDLSGYPREDLALAGQKVFEDVVGELLRNLFQLGISDNLILGGGCALNSSNNGLILARTGFVRLYVPSAPADDGNAVGAAWLSFKQDNPDWQPVPKLQSPYLGSLMSRETVKRFSNFGLIKKQSSAGSLIFGKTAQLLAEGKIVAWVQGQAEFGPRALGNRSILADPRQADMKDIINSRVKFREDFRPFAPSIMHEYGTDYFENYQESPYMDRALLFKESVRSKIPAVVHVDGTGRLQTVKREWNKNFYDLIAEFHRITGIPLLLNTNLNIMGRPIVHSLEDVLGMFYTTGLDALVIDDILIEK